MKKALIVIKNFWKLVILLLLVAITFSYAMFQGGFVSWFLFYSFLPFALYGLALSIYRFKKVDAKREFTKTDFYAGETITVRIQIKRPSFFPLFYLVIEDQLSDSFLLKKNRTKGISFPYFHKKIDFEYVIENLPRGEHYFQEIHLKTGDPLGLIERQISIPTSADKMIVYPAYKELLYRPLESRFDQGMTASKDRVQRDTSIAVGIREYQPGDRFSWINWKATAKRNEIMTKEFEQRDSHDVFIIMDCAPDKRFEVIVSFTASIIRAILLKGAQVGLYTASTNRNLFPIRGGEAHLQQLSYHLAKVADKCPEPLDKVLAGESLLAGKNASLILVTSQISKQLVEIAGYYASRRGSVNIFVIKGEKEKASNEEVSLKATASARGVGVVLIYDGRFSEAFAEVNRG